jgi:hypothetical protein
MGWRMDAETLYTLALGKWGVRAQEGMLIEEIGEVLVKFNKRIRDRNGCSEEDFMRELVDLQIMVEQMEMLYPVELWQTVRKHKLERLASMLGYEEVEIDGTIET